MKKKKKQGDAAVESRPKDNHLAIKNYPSELGGD